MQSFAKDKQIIVEGYLRQFKNSDDPILITRKELIEFMNQFFGEMGYVLDWKNLKLSKKKNAK